MSGFSGVDPSTVIPADVRMISGCQDHQTSADVSNVNQFKLPDPAGKAGGACTSALLKTLYHEGGENMSFVQVLTNMRKILNKQGSYTQIPQLSSSRQMDVQEPFDIDGNGGGGSKHAVLIGINYVGQQGQLSGCHNDVGNIRDYLMERQGFREKNIHILMDDGSHESPTHANILNAFRRLTKVAEAGDACFVHYSGHGGRMEDDNGDEEDGYDETLIPVDYQRAGQIRDDVVFNELVAAMPAGVTMTCLMDCCHSGSVLDLPYVFKADGEQTEMGPNPKSDVMNKLTKMAIVFMIRKIFGRGQVATIATVLLVNNGPQSLGALTSIASTMCAK